MKKQLTDYLEFKYGTSITGYILIIVIFLTLFLFSCVSSKPVPEPPVKKTPRLGYDKTM